MIQPACLRFPVSRCVMSAALSTQDEGEAALGELAAITRQYLRED